MNRCQRWLVFGAAGIASLSAANLSHELWPGFKIKKKLSPGFELELKQQVRFHQDAHTIKKTITEGTFDFNWSKCGTIFFLYRYSNFPDKITHRLAGGGQIKWKFSPITVQYRCKLQREIEKSHDSETMLRNRLKLEWKSFDKITPILGYETFHEPDHHGFQFQEQRFFSELEIELLKHQSINFLFMIKREDLQKLSPQSVYISGLDYEFEF